MSSKATSPDTQSACWLCGRRSLTTFPARPLVGAQTFRYARCGGCGLARLVETPATRDLAAFYATEYEPVCGDFARGQRSLLARLRETNYQLMALRLEARVGRGRALDVGCGAGVFLATLHRRGWEVAGVEPHLEYARELRERHGLDVRAGTLEEAPTEWGPFDVVSLLDVIEHLPDPLGALADARRLLRPGGILAIATPNVASLEHRLFGRHWFALQPPDHLWLFSPRSLREVVRRAGFERVELAASPVSYAWPSIRRVLGLPAPPGGLDAALKAAAALPMAAAGLLARAPCNLELYARRPG